jgi:hypothetical protein
MMKFNWKRAVNIFLFVLFFRVVFELGFYAGLEKSPSAYDRKQLELAEKGFIECMEMLKNG